MMACPKCGNEKAYFIGPICGDCHASGKDLGSKREADVGKIKRVECEWCGEPKLNIYEHRRICKQRPASGEEAPAGQPSPRRRRLKRKSRAVRVNEVPIKPIGCVFCNGTPNAAMLKDLVTRMIRGGMSFEASANVARDVLGILAARQ